MLERWRAAPLHCEVVAGLIAGHGLGVNPGLSALVLGVDRLLDRCRTTLNVAGDITAATHVARAQQRRLLTDVVTSAPVEPR